MADRNRNQGNRYQEYNQDWNDSRRHDNRGNSYGQYGGTYDQVNYSREDEERYQRYLENEGYHQRSDYDNFDRRNFSNRQGASYGSGGNYNRRDEGYEGGYGSGAYNSDYERNRNVNYDRGYTTRNLRHSDEDRYRSTGDYNRNEQRHRGERDWWDRASDEVASWFGDDDAERRRRMDKVSGPHRGKGPKGYSRSDERIREDISDRLSDDPYVDASEIEVRVNNREVVLEGTVESKEAKRRAEDLAEDVMGVSSVENHLKVARTATTVGSTNIRSNSEENRERNRGRNSWL